MKTKKPTLFLFCLLAVLLLGLLGAKPIYNAYRDLTFYREERSEEAREVKAFAEAQGLSIGEWPWEIIGLYENNPETRDFVLNYPFREAAEVDITNTSANTVPLFLQWDPMWGYEDYGSSCIAVTGCGPTCLAMAGYYVTGDTDFNPLSMAEFSMKNGYYAPGYGSSWTLISEGGVKLGLDVTEIPLVKKRITDNLKVNNPIILAMGPGDFTSEGHYILLVGMEDGLFRVHDPNSPANSQRLWSYEELEGQIRNIWVIR